MLTQWCPKCQEWTECASLSYRLEKSLRRTETICPKCGLTISTLTEEIKLSQQAEGEDGQI